MTSPLTHFDGQGQAHMVDVAAKAETHRVARATGHIRMLPATFELIASGAAKKGDVIAIARIAAIQGAKRTAELIPLCHPLPITRVAVDFELDRAAAEVRCTAQVEFKVHRHACDGQRVAQRDQLGRALGRQDGGDARHAQDRKSVV